MTNSLNFSFVQLPSIISTAIMPCSDKAGNIVYRTPRTNTFFLTAKVFFKEYPYPRDKLRSSLGACQKSADFIGGGGLGPVIRCHHIPFMVKLHFYNKNI